MIHTNDKVIKHKVGLLNLAEELGNVSKACKMMGLSRDTFYRYKEASDEGGVEALFDRNRRTPNLKNRVDPESSLSCLITLWMSQHMGKLEPAMSCAS